MPFTTVGVQAEESIPEDGGGANEDRPAGTAGNEGSISQTHDAGQQAQDGTTPLDQSQVFHSCCTIAIADAGHGSTRTLQHKHGSFTGT